MQEDLFTYSFIIPHHNSPKLLNRCLDSIPQREDIQIIVVDDNSDEDKQPQIKRNDVEVIYIDAEHTKGAGRARNYGLKAAKGKWLLFADCDDYYNEGFLDVLDQYKDDNIEVLYFSYNYIDEKEGVVITDSILQKTIMLYDGSREKADYIKFRNNTPWTKMIRTSFVALNHIFYEEVENGNDVLFSLLLGYRVSNIKVIDNRLYNYVKTSGSICTRKQSADDIMCRITHIVKHHYFNSSIGYYKWNANMFRNIASCMMRSHSQRFKTFCSLLKGVPTLWNKRKEWVDIIND